MDFFKKIDVELRKEIYQVIILTNILRKTVFNILSLILQSDE
jgi:hypothetical protein